MRTRQLYQHGVIPYQKYINDYILLGDGNLKRFRRIDPNYNRVKQGENNEHNRQIGLQAQLRSQEDFMTDTSLSTIKDSPVVGEQIASISAALTKKRDLLAKRAGLLRDLRAFREEYGVHTSFESDAVNIRVHANPSDDPTAKAQEILTSSAIFSALNHKGTAKLFTDKLGSDGVNFLREVANYDVDQVDEARTKEAKAKFTKLRDDYEEVNDELEEINHQFKDTKDFLGVVKDLAQIGGKGGGKKDKQDQS